MREDLTGTWQAKERGCPEARASLVHRYRCLVPATRQKRMLYAPERFWEDMEAEGYLMLVRCVDQFDRSRGVQFPTYAITKIWGAMTEVLRREDWTPRSERERERTGDPHAVIREVVSLEYTLAEEPGEIDRLADPYADVEEQVLAKISRETLWRLVSCLSRRDQYIVCRRYRDETTLERVAGELNLCAQRVKQLDTVLLSRLRHFCEWAGVADGF